VSVFGINNNFKIVIDMDFLIETEKSSQKYLPYINCIKNYREVTPLKFDFNEGDSSSLFLSKRSF
jgi:hypothetical protein